MIRSLFGSALLIVGFATSAAFLGPDLVTGPRGEPLLVAAPQEASLQPAAFDGEGCSSTLVFAEPFQSGHQGTRITAFALRSGNGDVAVALEDIPGGERTAVQTIVLLFDKDGRLIAAGDRAALEIAEAASNCVELPRAPDMGAGPI